MAKSSVKQKDIADIMNRIEEALFETDYVPVGYDNTDTWLHVIIDRKMGKPLFLSTIACYLRSASPARLP